MSPKRLNPFLAPALLDVDRVQCQSYLEINVDGIQSVELSVPHADLGHDATLASVYLGITGLFYHNQLSVPIRRVIAPTEICSLQNACLLLENMKEPSSSSHSIHPYKSAAPRLASAVDEVGQAYLALASSSSLVLLLPMPSSIRRRGRIVWRSFARLAAPFWPLLSIVPLRLACALLLALPMILLKYCSN